MEWMIVTYLLPFTIVKPIIVGAFVALWACIIMALYEMLASHINPALRGIGTHIYSIFCP